MATSYGGRHALATALILLGVLASFPDHISAGPGGEVSIMFRSYLNAFYKKYENGRVKCCDLFCSGCDPYFNLCLKMRSGGACHAHFRSRVYRKASRALTFKAGSYLGNGKSNPLKYTFSAWEGKIYLNIDVKDYDTITRDDDVDSYSYSTAVVPTSAMRRQQWSPVRLQGRVSTMFLWYSVRCNKDYYGPRCTTRCQPRDDFRGHYTCDKVTGRKTCNKGWYGASCITTCQQSNNNGHYHCNTDGDKICLPGWYGDNCMTTCLPKHDKTEGFICDKNGGKMCLKNYYGVECDTYCAPNNSRYSCNNVTGQKECTGGWYGAECDVQCTFNNGNFEKVKCDGNGDPMCRDNFYGDDCDTFCKPRDDDVNGHYTCDNQTGSKVCRPQWHGSNCTVYCDPQDDADSGYTCNGTTGEKVCASEWAGPNCDCYATDSMHAGYICNDTTGQRICLEGWTGIHCNISTATPTPTVQSCATPAEIGVLFDSSASIGGPNFLLMKYFVASLVEQVASSPPRFSVMRYNAWPILYLSFKDTRKLTVKGLVRKVVGLRYIPGATRTDRALNAARTIFTKPNGGGTGSPKILIVLSDGKSKMDPKTYKKALTSLKALGVRIISIGVGGDVDMADLTSIAMNKPRNVIRVRNFRQLNHTLGKLAKLIPCSTGQQPN